MKLKINNYTYKNPKLDNYTILNFSDTHGDVVNIELILNFLKKKKVDLILVPGDIFDRIDIDNKEFVNRFKKLAQYAKTYIVLGNHDNLLKTNKMLALEGIEYNKYIKELNDTKNIFFCVSQYEKIELDKNIDLNFIVLPNYYFQKKEDIKLSKQFLSTLEDKEINKKKFNIMLIHTPRAILEKKKLINNKLINNMDLIVAGHNHGGLTPTSIQDMFNNHIGLFGPYYSILEPHSYGIFKKDNTHLLISNGVTKVSKTTILKKIGYSLNNILIPEIDIITFKKAKDYNLELINREIDK